MHTVELLIPHPYFSEVKIAIEKLKGYKFPGIDQNLTKLITSRRENFIFCSSQTYSIWSKEELKRKESITVPVALQHCFKCAINKVQVNWDGLQLNGETTATGLWICQLIIHTLTVTNHNAIRDETSSTLNLEIVSFYSVWIFFIYHTWGK
jgi:hypothetical protein